MNDETAKKKFKWWKIPVIVLVAAVLIVAGYLSYVFITYSRIEDNVKLDVTDGVRGETADSGSADVKPAIGTEYTIVTYNVGFGAYTPDFTFFMDGGKESRAKSKQSVIDCTDGAMNVAKQYGADIVLYQEVDTDSDRSYHVNQCEMFKDCFSDYDSVFAVNYHSAYLMYPITRPHGKSNSGIQTLSKFDIDSALRRRLPVADGVQKILDLDRCYSISRIPTENGRELVIFNTHLSAYGTDETLSNAQLDMIFADMEKEYKAGNYVIMGGDLNHDFTGDSVGLLNNGEESTLSWTVPISDDSVPEGFKKCENYADGLVPSARDNDIPYGPDSFTVVIDGFIISDNIECTYVQNIDTGFGYSDHNPVVMKFKLKAN